MLETRRGARRRVSGEGFMAKGRTDMTGRQAGKQVRTEQAVLIGKQGQLRTGK